MTDNKLIIAIDGPAAAGKSTTARLVAERLGYVYIDTGAMYRAATLAVLRQGIDPSDRVAVEALVRELDIRLVRVEGKPHTLLDGQDVSQAIRTPEVTGNVSLVSSYPGVRQPIVVSQQRMAVQSSTGVVLDGRDIGTVVFPTADLKVFLVADLRSRASRRLQELAEANPKLTVEQLEEELQKRDTFDSSRPTSPLTRAGDAIEIDTSALTIDQQVNVVVNLALARQGELDRGASRKGRQ